jgi:quercetin dioxygenase-like cupin family protein
VGRHPARKLASWEIIFVEKGTLTILEENTLFEVKAGESLLLWPDRRHVGVEDFPADLKFYWLHFEVENTGQGSLSGNRTTLQRQGCAICHFSVPPVSE